MHSSLCAIHMVNFKLNSLTCNVIGIRTTDFILVNFSCLLRHKMLKQLARTTNAWSGHHYSSTLALVIYDSVRSQGSSQFDLSVEISS